MLGKRELVFTYSGRSASPDKQRARLDPATDGSSTNAAPLTDHHSDVAPNGLASSLGGQNGLLHLAVDGDTAPIVTAAALLDEDMQLNSDAEYEEDEASAPPSLGSPIMGDTPTVLGPVQADIVDPTSLSASIHAPAACAKRQPSAEKKDGPAHSSVAVVHATTLVNSAPPKATSQGTWYASSVASDQSPISPPSSRSKQGTAHSKVRCHESTQEGHRASPPSHASPPPPPLPDLRRQKGAGFLHIWPMKPTIPYPLSQLPDPRTTKTVAANTLRFRFTAPNGGPSLHQRNQATTSFQSAFTDVGMHITTQDPQFRWIGGRNNQFVDVTFRSHSLYKLAKDGSAHSSRYPPLPFFLVVSSRFSSLCSSLYYYPHELGGQNRAPPAMQHQASYQPVHRGCLLCLACGLHLASKEVCYTACGVLRSSVPRWAPSCDSRAENHLCC